MLGLSVGSTPAICMTDDSRKRVRMSLALLATTNCDTGRPMRCAPYPANTLPKLPVGTAKPTGPRPPVRRATEVT